MALRSGFRRSLAGVLFASAVLAAIAYPYRSRPIVEPGMQAAKTGLVLDAQTRQPIAGAYVVARWLQQSREMSFQSPEGMVEGQCMFRIVARTDALGRYEIPSSAGRFNIDSPRSSAERKYYWDAYAYAPGYGAADSKAAHPRLGSSSMPANQELEPILLSAAEHAAPDQRIAALIDTAVRFTCAAYSPAQIPAAEQVYAEAYAAACLPEPNDAARSLPRLRNPAKPAQDAQPCSHFPQANNP